MDRRGLLSRVPMVGLGLAGLVAGVGQTSSHPSGRRVDMRQDNSKYGWHVLLNGVHRCCPAGDVFLADEAEGIIGFYRKNAHGDFYREWDGVASDFERGAVVLIPAPA